MPTLGTIDVEDDVAVLIADRKNERWSSYKEVRAVCNIVKDHTRMPIDSFKLGDEFHVRAVQPGEVRIVPPNRLAKNNPI